MITVYRREDSAIKQAAPSAGASVPGDALWIDLHEPEAAEASAVERAFGLSLPTPADMEEIEISSRLYEDRRASYMTATILTRADTDTPVSVPISFVLTRRTLITVRYADPQPFRQFVSQIERTSQAVSGHDLLAGLLDALVDRIADILEYVQRDINALSAEVFARDRARGDVDFNEVLRVIGQSQGLVMRAFESLLSLGRLVTFASRPDGASLDKEARRDFDTVGRDVSSLNEHASYLSNNINFLLDATLGMINIEQTGIIKIFSVAAVVFLPPTLIASIYGMNFKVMPELDWTFGYPASLVLMVVSAILPYLYFKHKGWL